MADLHLLALVEQARAENPKPLLTADEVAHCLYRAAQLAQLAGHDVGVLLKPSGSGGLCPVGRISLDILIDIPDQQEYDAFGSADGENGAPGPAIPTWQKLPFKVGIPPSGASMDRVRRPFMTVPIPTPEPPSDDPPSPSPSPIDLDALVARVVAGVVADLKPQLDLILAVAMDTAADTLRERPIELRVPTFGGTARGVLKTPSR